MTKFNFTWDLHEHRQGVLRATEYRNLSRQWQHMSKKTCASWTQKPIFCRRDGLSTQDFLYQQMHKGGQLLPWAGKLFWDRLTWFERKRESEALDAAWRIFIFRTLSWLLPSQPLTAADRLRAVRSKANTRHDAGSALRGWQPSWSLLCQERSWKASWGGNVCFPNSKSERPQHHIFMSFTWPVMLLKHQNGTCIPEHSWDSLTKQLT